MWEIFNNRKTQQCKVKPAKGAPNFNNDPSFANNDASVAPPIMPQDPSSAMGRISGSMCRLMAIIGPADIPDKNPKAPNIPNLKPLFLGSVIIIPINGTSDSRPGIIGEMGNSMPPKAPMEATPIVLPVYMYTFLSTPLALHPLHRVLTFLPAHTRIHFPVETTPSPRLLGWFPHEIGCHSQQIVYETYRRPPGRRMLFVFFAAVFPALFFCLQWKNVGLVLQRILLVPNVLPNEQL